MGLTVPERQDRACPGDGDHVAAAGREASAREAGVSRTVGERLEAPGKSVGGWFQMTGSTLSGVHGPQRRRRGGEVLDALLWAWTTVARAVLPSALLRSL